ncbi:fimbrial protein [Superficieibacter sp. BNK-5]|uniref:fimbrial protein n=1 Tax=Superficieibacter sp. BNK-5 TaxID=3376142 RepID=UPI0039BFF6A4
MNMRWINLSFIALALLSAQATAESFGNGTGWCEPTTGSHSFAFHFDQTITDSDENRTGKIVEEHWNLGGEYATKCDCDNADYKGPNYFTATTGNLTQKGTFSESRYYGHMDYYVLVPGKLEIGTEALVAGKLSQTLPIPFTAVSNEDYSAQGCKGAEMKAITAGNKGTVRLYVTHPLVGQIIIPETTIMNLYLSKANTAGGSNIPPAVPPVAHVTLSGTITVPQSCTINAGQIIEVKFDPIMAKDIKNVGDSPTRKTTAVNFTCSNVADGTNLSMSLSGENDPHNTDYLKTTNDNIGVRISDKYDNTIVPNGSAELPVDNYADGKGSTEFTAAPVNTTGYISGGEFQATATLEVQIR